MNSRQRLRGCCWLCCCISRKAQGGRGGEETEQEGEGVGGVEKMQEKGVEAVGPERWEGAWF